MILRRYFITVLMCMSLIISDVEHFFLLAFCMSSLKKCLFRSFDNFLIGLLFFNSELNDLFVYFDVDCIESVDCLG